MFLGIDIGTTAMKFAVIEEGKIKFQQSKPVATYRKESECYQLWSELLTTLKLGIQSIPKDLRAQIEKLSLSVAMHSLMVMDTKESDRLFIWSDTQAQTVIQHFKAEPFAASFYRKTGTPIHPMSPFAKILYFQETKKAPAHSFYYGLKELVMHYLVGTYLIDYGTASATGLFHLTDEQWDPEILSYLGIREKQLALAVDTTTAFPMLPTAAEELMLPLDVEVVIGASDGCLAAYAGFQATNIPNSLTIGTSASVRRVTNKPIFHNQKQNFCYYLKPGCYVSGAPSNNGGCVLEWASQIFADQPEVFFSALPEMLAASEIGACGLRFDPYINGERAPFWQADVTGGFRQLKIAHTKADMIRSIVEGVLVNLRTLTQLVAIEEAVSLSGGFFQSTVLQQLTCDILGLDGYLSDLNEPILGLYYLIYGKPLHPPQTIQTIHFDEDTYQQYLEKLPIDN